MGPDYFRDPAGIATEGVLSRSVRDSAALLDAISGPATGDSGAAPSPERPFLQEVGANPGRLRIAFGTSPGGNIHAHEDCIRAVQEAAALCAELGHDVEEAQPVVNLFPEDAQPVYSGYVAWDIDKWAKDTGLTPSEENLEPYSWMIYQYSREMKAVDFLLAETAAQQLARIMGHFLTRYDLFLTPTLAKPPVPIGEFSLPEKAIDMGNWMPFTPLANLTGQPAMSVPLNWNSESLPVGVQFVARFGDEATLFRLAAQLEEARPWADRRPPILA
jgi:Asp-tRNA(Asn)/Glu-tRNA(Gln) amidotransferase A subunit family amidase